MFSSDTRLPKECMFGGKKLVLSPQGLHSQGMGLGNTALGSEVPCHLCYRGSLSRPNPTQDWDIDRGDPLSIKEGILFSA